MNKFLFFIFTLFLCSPVYSLDYDYSSTRVIPICLSITEEISTAKSIYEGQNVKFKVLKTVYDDNDIIVKRGDIVSGKIYTIITNGMNGFPAEIILDDFEIPNTRKSQLVGTYTKAGVNKCLWVYPLKWALTPLFPAGSLTNFIRGGHAKIKTTDVITVYYYPEWK